MPDSDAVAVCIPFVDTNDEWRTKSRAFTQMHWMSMGLNVIYGTSEQRPVNRSAARNDAASKTDADVLVFADADTWIDDTQFWPMCDMALQSDRLVHGYTRLVKLSKKTTVRVLAGEDIRIGETIPDQPLGIVAVSRKLWVWVGGFDERFRGWGNEDRSFAYATETIAGKGRKVAGQAYHLWHPRAAENGRVPPHRRANIELGKRYKVAAGSPRATPVQPRTATKEPDVAAMVALLREQGGPLSLRERQHRKRAETLDTSY